MNKDYNDIVRALQHTLKTLPGAQSSTHQVGDATDVVDIIEVPRVEFLRYVNTNHALFSDGNLARRLGVGVLNPDREDFDTLLVGIYYPSNQSEAFVIVTSGCLCQEVIGKDETAKTHYAMSGYVTGNYTRFYMKPQTVTRLIEHDKMSLAELSKVCALGEYNDLFRLSYHEVNPGKEQSSQHFRTMALEAMTGFFTTFVTNAKNHPAI